MSTSTAHTPRGSLKSLAMIVLLVLGGTQGLSWWRDAQTAAEIKAHLRGQRITMYSTVSCFYCAQARDWLKRHSIPWDECDVERDEGCRTTFEAQGAPGTPMMRVGTHWHLGFEAGWLAEALKTPPEKQPAKESAQTQPSPKAETSPRP